jgi:hypothetical protein
MKFKYPKLTGFVIAVITAYFIFSSPIVKSFIANLNSLSNIGVFIGGMGYSFGFTSPFSAGFFADLNPPNILIAGLIGGFGALISDMFIFSLTRFSFEDEFKRIRRTKLIRKIGKFSRNLLGKRINSVLAYILAGIFIASPLPDEAGILVLTGLTKIKPNIMAAISFILNTIGILIILSL